MFRKHFNATTVVATVALVFAMTGGAYAAKRYLITSTKQISPAVLNQLKGAKGSAGAAGSAGTQGSPGAPGPKGETGAQGAAGQEGPEGKEGKTGLTGKEGKAGIEGKAGKEGPPGPTCNASGECNLPSGASETGLWSLAGNGLQESATAAPLVTITYPLHLTFVPTAKFIPYPESFTAGSVAGCPGTMREPAAEAGNLCVYAIGGGLELSEILQSPFVDGETGAMLGFKFESEQSEASMYGSWAVKAS